jgi:integration host factor subunit beta
MTKSDLVKKVQITLPDCPARDVAVAVDIVFGAMTRAMKNNERIDVRGFGNFTVRERRPRQARNPRSGSPVQVDARRVPFFKVGKELQTRINAPR